MTIQEAVRTVRDGGRVDVATVMETAGKLAGVCKHAELKECLRAAGVRTQPSETKAQMLERLREELS